MKTTLNKIREQKPCQEGWEKLLRSLNKTKADDEPVTILQVLDSNGRNDALWCLCAVVGYDREIRLYGVWCARQVEHLMTDQRSKDALDVAERFVNGLATEQELTAARNAAYAAAYGAAWDAAGTSAWAAWNVVGNAAWNAVGNAAWAAGTAARAARTAQEKELRRVCVEIAEQEQGLK